MAIVEMSRVSLLAMREDRERVLRILQQAGCVEITELDGEAAAYVPAQGHGSLETADERLSRIRWTLGKLGRYDTTKTGLLSSLGMPEVDAETAQAIDGRKGELMAVVEAAEECERRSGDLRGQETRLHAQIDQLLPWRALDIPVERIGDTRETIQFTGSVNNRKLEALQATLSELPATLEHIGDERENAFVWIIAYRDAAFEVQNALKEAEFSAVHFADESGTVAHLLDGLRAQIQALQLERDAVEEELKALAAHIPDLKLLYEIISAEKEREQAASRFAQTGATFLMEGWMPAAATEKLEARLRRSVPDIAVSFRAPLDEEKPPSLLRNNKVVAPFETIVTSYSYPDPRGFDPTTIMAPFFACLFGMMLSDAGYGIVLTLAIPLIIHFFKPKEGMRKLMWVLFFGGIFTIFWGAMFDTWFGESVKPMLINTLEQPLEMMALCMGMGALHLFTGLGVAAYMNIRRGKVLDAVFDQGLWLILIVGLPLMLLPATAAVGKWMAILGAVGILLTAGREKPSIVGKLIGGAGALYNISSWLSDLLSYMRLFGMGLATGVIGMVINMLVGLMMGKNIIFTLVGVAILIGGHLFNFAINALGAYVHSCRLQYIEFFSKFYEDGGVPFKPLSQKPHYVAIREPVEGVES